MRIKFMMLTAGALLSLGVVRPSLLPVRAPEVVYAATAAPNLAVGPQYDTAHVYVTPENFDRFVASLSPPSVAQPPSKACSLLRPLRAAPCHNWC